MSDVTHERGPATATRFVALTFAMGWGAAAMIRAIAGPMDGPLDPAIEQPARWAIAAFSTVFALAPVVCTVVLARAAGIRLRLWGLRMPAVSTLLVMPLVALALAAVATALPILVGISDFDPSGAGEVERLANARSIEALTLQLELAEDPQPLKATVLRGLIVGTLFGVLLAPIIELPWRGLVLTELSPPGFARAALATSVLAALWWLPLWLLVGTGGFRSAGAVLAFAAAYALLGIPMAWVRLRSGSVIPGSVLAVSLSALSSLPRLATSGGTHLQLELCSLAAVGLLAAAALLWPPRLCGSPAEEEV
ncbi:MAG TPA: hypothetical protein DEP45_14530 [Armatimonadetes bacterium]|nr:hypothetical protein [Armatimonadota bacterium]